MSLPPAPITGTLEDRQYEALVARNNNKYGDSPRHVAAGPVNADGIEPSRCMLVDAKRAGADTQFRLSPPPPPWITAQIDDEFDRYLNALTLPIVEGFIVRTSLPSAKDYFRVKLVERGFVFSYNGFVEGRDLNNIPFE